MNTKELIEYITDYMEELKEYMHETHKDQYDYKEFLKSHELVSSGDTLIEYIDNCDFSEFEDLAYTVGEIKTCEDLVYRLNKLITK